MVFELNLLTGTIMDLPLFEIIKTFLQVFKRSVGSCCIPEKTLKSHSNLFFFMILNINWLLFVVSKRYFTMVCWLHASLFIEKGFFQRILQIPFLWKKNHTFNTNCNIQNSQTNVPLCVLVSHLTFHCHSIKNPECLLPNFVIPFYQRQIMEPSNTFVLWFESF